MYWVLQACAGRPGRTKRSSAAVKINMIFSSFLSGSREGRCVLDPGAADSASKVGKPTRASKATHKSQSTCGNQAQRVASQINQKIGALAVLCLSDDPFQGGEVPLDGLRVCEERAAHHLPASTIQVHCFGLIKTSSK